jgi:redox-sensing transcriptional repressor
LDTEHYPAFFLTLSLQTNPVNRVPLIWRGTCRKPEMNEARMERVDLPPDVVIRRLPLYARSLRYLLREDVRSISSQELGERLNVTAAQIRKDLSYFGEFGKQGIGYDVEQLLEQIERILGLKHNWAVALVGVGHLGQAVVGYEGFRRDGIHIVALFDSDPRKIGSEIAGLTVMSNDQITPVIQQQDIKMAIVAVPAQYAQQVTNILVEAGVRAILNYAPITVQAPPGVWVRYIDPVAVLHSMTYYLARDDNRVSA